MAQLTNPSSPSSSSSHPSSPEPEHLADMDPPPPPQDAPHPQQLPPALPQEHDNAPRHSPPQPSPTELARIRSTGRGGCWTCRVRRKKCDEERVDGGSCKTCRRLGIECLGWGPRRPDWMRDKEKVAEYKARIKEQLTRAGLIRGQPRSVYASLSGGSSTRYTPLAGPSTLRRAPSEHYAPYANVQGYDAARFAQAAAGGGLSALSGLGDALGGASASPELGLPSPFVLAGGGYAPGLPYGGADMGGMAGPSTYAGAPFLHTPELAPSITPGLRDSPFNEQPEPFIQYYFDHVRKIQFPLAGRELTQTLYFILQTESRGPLDYALCALASLHSARAAAVAQGFEAPPAEAADRAVDRRFYKKAYVMLMTAKATGTPYTERDAVAAVFLITYHNLAGGGTGWTALWEVAHDWLAQTGIQDEQNPKLALVNMSPVQKLAAKATMWVDVLSSIVFATPPRFLALYRRLFGAASGGGYWAAANNDQLDLRMDRLTGCPDEALLALAESAALAHWKATESAKGALSVRELVRRADAIEQTLRAHPARVYAESPVAEAAPGVPSGMPAPAEPAPEGVRRSVAGIWRETAALFLHSVLHGPHPGVPEIAKSSNALIDDLHALPPSDAHYALVLPYILTGVLAADPLVCELVKQRLSWHRDDFFNGSMSQGRTFVEYVHARRAAANAAAANSAPLRPPLDWRECMRERWSAVIIA